jgi:hypothetical protein
MVDTQYVLPTVQGRECYSSSARDIIYMHIYIYLYPSARSPDGTELAMLRWGAATQ